MKIRTQSQLIDALDDEFGWRIKEIDDVKRAVRAADIDAKRSIIRAGIPLLYAHWEGFIKASSELLINFVRNQGLAYLELQPCFIAFGARRRLHELSTSGDARQRIAVIEFFLNELNQRAEFPKEGLIVTDSNLSSVVFERIATSLGVDVSRYDTHFLWIDESLLERRNKIAHGKFLDVDAVQFDEIAEVVIKLLNNYKTDLANLVVTRQYLRS